MEKKVEQMIEQLGTHIPEKMDELGEILTYGEKMKAEGEIKKQEFWSKHGRDDFLNLLEYKRKHRKEIESKYKYLSGMEGIKRKMFIQEYLHDNMLYSGKIKEDGKEYGYGGFFENYLDLYEDKIGDEGAREIAKNMELKEGVTLDLGKNEIGSEGAEAIAENLKLKDGVTLNLSWNKIGDKGAEAIAENLKLKDGVTLNLSWNEIGDEGAIAIAENLKLKDGVTLNLYNNQIGDDGAEAIMKNMEFKDGVKLNLRDNKISYEMKEKLRNCEKHYNDKGIHCKIEV